MSSSVAQLQSTQSSVSTPSNASSAWLRGPPGTTGSNASSNPSSAIATPTHSIGSPLPPAAGQAEIQDGAQRGQGASNGGMPISAGPHSRKGSLMVGGGVDIKRGNLAFGTVDSPNPLLSSSPAVPSLTGGHLADNVKSFGSIDADDNSDPSAVKAGPRSSTSASPLPGGSPAPKKELNLHSLFGAKPQQNGSTPSMASAVHPPNPSSVVPGGMAERRQSMSQNGPPNAFPNAYPYQNGPGQPHLRPPQANGVPGQRSPMSPHAMAQAQFGNQIPIHLQQGFRPPGPQMQQPGPQTRPNGMPQGMMGQQRNSMMMQQQPYGMQGYPMMAYQQQGQYYNQYTPYDSSQYAQWAAAQQQHQPGFNMGMSPRGPPASLGQPGTSPSPHPSTLPSSGGPSPVPTPAVRPGPLGAIQTAPSTVSNSSIPSTPSRPANAQSPAVFSPSTVSTGSTPFSMSTNASSFTPRTSKAIVIKRDDGSVIDLKAVAGTKATPAATPAAEKTINSEGDVAPVPAQVKKPQLPVIVRLESEDQKKKRLEEEAQKKRIREEEAREEQERKERNERRAREQAQKEENEKSEKEAQAKADEEKRKTEEALAAQQAAAKKLEDERAAVEAAAAKEAEASKEKEREVQAKHAEAEAASKEADSQPTAAMLTPAASTVASPSTSPRLGGAASLPPKPQVTPGAARKFPTVDTSAATTSPALSEDNTPSRAAASLTRAQPISDLASITYPESAQAPQLALNSDTPTGKFRYDRDFLLQFAEVCKEKPESLPNLEDIGMEPDNGSNYGTSRSGPRSARGGMGPPSARAGTGLGIPGIGGGRQGFPNQGMGSFTMGTFSSGSSLRGTDSEARYKASLSRGGMARTPSQGGPGLGGLPPMGGSSSRGGPRNRGPRRGTQDNRSSTIDDGTAPLVSSQNAWSRARPADNDESSPMYIERKVKALLNKLTAENFDSISKQILDWANKSKNENDGFTLKLVIKLIFEKATDEAHWSAMYARLCKLMHESLDEGVHETIEGRDMAGGNLFRKYLLNRCQMDFEAGWKAREDAATAAAAKSEEDKAQLARQAKEAEEGGEKGEAVMLSDEYYIAQKAKRRGLGLVQLVGELYKAEMIGKGVIKNCFLRLLGNVETPDEEDIESACKLLTTVGALYEKQSPDNVDVVMERLQVIVKGDTLPSRIKFMVLDVIDLKRTDWKQRNKQAGVMTIQEIHELAAKEQVQKAQAAAQAQRESVSRGGSMAGRARGQIGEWQNVAAGGARAPQRPADMSGLGRISSAGLPAAPSFGGPTSVFANRRGVASRTGATPPLSRQPSSTNITTNSNMFNALNQLGAEPAEAGASADRRGSADAQTPTDSAQRPKLNLAPRTKPLPGQDGEGDVAEESEPAKSAEDDSASLDTDMKELWGEKDAGGTRDPEEIVHFFAKRPEAAKVQLAERLVADVFRIAKIKDADVVANGFRSATEQGAVSHDALKAGIAAKIVTLDDEAIDFPNAYKAMAILLRGADATDEEVTELAGKIDAFEPVTPPLERLQQALAKVDEEGSA